jgi:hypothetical protein
MAEAAQRHVYRLTVVLEILKRGGDEYACHG